MSLEETPVAPAGPADGADGRSLARGAARNFGWGALSFGANRLLVFISTLVLARILVPEDFGTVAAAMAVVLYFEIALDLGVGAAVIYEQEQGITPRVQTAFTLNLMTAVGLTLLGVAFAPLIASFFHLQHQVTLFRVLFCYLLIRGCGTVQDSVLKRNLQFGRRTFLDLTRGIVRAALSIVLALAGYHAWAMIWGLLAGELAATVLAFVLVPFRPTLRLQRGASRLMLGFGLTVLALKVTDAIEIDSDYLVVGRRLGPTSLGYYTVGFRLPELLLFNVFWIFSSVAFPAYAKARTLGTTLFGPAMLRALQLITLYAFPGGVALALTAHNVVTVLFGARWEPAVGAMQLIALSAAMASVGYASGDIYSASGKPGTLLAIDAPKALIIIAAMWLAAPYGITAVAGVHLVAQTIYAVVRLHLANRIVATTWRQTLVALRPAGTCAASVAVLVAPVTLLLPEGPVTLLAQVAAVAAGAGVGLFVGGGLSAVREMTGIARGSAA